jgi:hypothetical protein
MTKKKWEGGKWGELPVCLFMWDAKGSGWSHRCMKVDGHLDRIHECVCGEVKDGRH